MSFGDWAGPVTVNSLSSTYSPEISQSHIVSHLLPKMVVKIEKSLHAVSIVDLRETMESAKQQVGL